MCLPQNLLRSSTNKLLYSHNRIRVIFTSNHQSEASSEETKNSEEKAEKFAIVKNDEYGSVVTD
jgi:hypothetical protein